MRKEQATVARRMARYACEVQWEDLPEYVRSESVRAMLNWTACAVGGAKTASMEAAVKGVMAMTQHGATPILGRAERTGVADAALLTCLSSSVQTFDDTHLATITHPTGPVAGALLAASHALSADGHPVTGKDFLAALAIGIEIECRVSKALAAGGSHIGWFMTGLSGGIGAAAAVGRLLRLSEDQMTWAIGLGAAQAGGVRATHGTMAIAMVPGMVARNGLAAAYWAQADFTAGEIMLDGRNSLMDVVSDTAYADLMLQDLGVDFEMTRNSYKPYPCGIVIHPSIDACLQLSNELGEQVNEVESLTLTVHPDAMRLCWRKLPETALDAQVSVYHWAAAALLHGQATLQEGTLECVMNPQVRSLQERIEVVVSQDLADNQAVAEVQLKNGLRHEARVDNAIGSVSNPMSTEQLADKFMALCEPILGSDQAGRLLNFCLNMAEATDIAAIFETGVVSHSS